MKLNKLFLLGAVLFIASAVSAQDLISADELKKNLKNPEYIIVNAAANQKVFVRGAIDLPHGILCTDEPIRNVIKSPEEMAVELGNSGVSSDKTIVVYDEGSTKYAGRMYWMLKYLGAPNVKMLDGNITGWKAVRGPIGTATKGKKATFTANVDANQLATMEEVKKAVDNSSYVIVDARTPEEYAGTAETELARPGHVPGAVNVNYETLINGKSLLKSNDALTSMFESKGITKDKTVIVYCETSVRAGIIYLALKGLGYPNVKVYDGAYLEWQSVDSNNVI
ncbi:MAG TPA: sulfurtransferase [Draconibacterium sp.]|nr:sulfurtransferase [Draconibacterium sp.]